MMKVHRMTKHFRPRSKSWKTGHILMLSMIGFVWYSLVSKRTHGRESSSLIRRLQGFGETISDQIPHQLENVPIQPQQEAVVSQVQESIPEIKINEVANDRGQEVQNNPESDKRNLKPLRKKETNLDKMSNSAKKKPDGRLAENNKAQSQREDVDDPFNRKALGIKKQVALAERDPIEAVGRKNRPKLGDIVTTPPKEAPIILVWKAMEYQMKNYKEHLEFIAPPECGGCQITTNRSLVRECTALVHFNSPDLRKLMDVPNPEDRNPRQIYAFWSRETPAKTVHFSEVLKDPRFDPIFNLTINFRQDSDIVDYFGNVQYELHFFREKQKFNGWFERMISRKSGLAIWAVSNCNSTYGAAERMKYAQSLIKAGLDLTAYGLCFNNRNNGADLVKELQSHKFYLSLENSIHCPDYVSEKFWRNGLRSGAVPIVWGPTREDVVKIAPKGSFIHTDDFKSPKKLIQYLEYLDKNDTAYREYHAWRFQPIDKSILYEEIIPTHRSTLCRLCKKVVARPLMHKTIPSVYEWLYKTRYVDDLCFKS